MTLSKEDIKKYCTDQSLVCPYDEKNVQTCSYDLTFGGEYYFYREKDGNRVNIVRLRQGEKLYIPADAICYILTEETVQIPNNLTASISLSFGLIKKGVMLAAQPPYDPGYKGKTVALLHNLSDEEVEISVGEHILNIVFSTLSSPVSDVDLYQGKYQGLNSLNEYCTKVKKGAIFVLKQDLEKQKKNFNNFLTTLLTIITVIIAVLTILFTFLTISDLFQSSAQKGSVEDQEELSFIIDESTNTLVIVIDGKQYELKLEDETAEEQESGTMENISGEE